MGAFFDTGAGMSVLDQQLREALPDGLEESEAVEVEDATGSKHQIPTVRCHNLDVGGHQLGPCRFLVIDLGMMERKTGSQAGLVFGLNAMLGSRWILDKERGAVRLMR